MVSNSLRSPQQAANDTKVNLMALKIPLKTIKVIMSDMR